MSGVGIESGYSMDRYKNRVRWGVSVDGCESRIECKV
jgi:hypothetical protein